ncbi:MAG TPA: S-methyl-5'-thioadenosine phosphorylase, partial [Nitrososphaerales archaeon]|nr:S-methyl-5'-thioadenosine phosphorylase [Nitrososphaerales archaeon]
KDMGIRCHNKGTVVVIQGPRFSTRAESRFFRAQGWDIINMTQYPEVILARELELCYVNISLVTDYDVGLEGDPKVKPVSNDEVMRVFNANLKRLRSLLLRAIELTPSKRSCPCGSAMRNARIKI